MRHLDTWQYKTLVHARIPRLNCPTCGVHQLKVPWSEPGSHFTALFEAMAKVLSKTKYLWLENPTGRSRTETLEFNQLRDQVNRTSRAWALKETAMGIWDMSYVGAADRNFKAWYGWARRSCLEPMRKVAAMIKRHWANIRTYFTHRITNAGSESMNARIQAVKRRACGFRSRERFRAAIYFHCGGLNLYPAMVSAGL